MSKDYHKTEFPPISSKSGFKSPSVQKFSKTLSPQKYNTNFPGKHLYNSPKPANGLSDFKEDKTGILTILKETKKEIVDQITELYNEGDPELFLQYANKVASLNLAKDEYRHLNMLSVFANNPIKPPGASSTKAKPHESISSDERTSINSSKIQNKRSKQHLQRVKSQFIDMLNKNHNNLMRFETQQKKHKVKQTKNELEKLITRRLRQNLDGPATSSQTQSAIQLLDSKPKILARDTDEEALKRMDKLKMQIEVMDSKLDNILYYQNTLRYMLNRDLADILYKKNMINELKAKKNKIMQTNDEIQKDVDKKNEEAEIHAKKKSEIEFGFKKYIQSMNDAATNILRDYEENVKVKQICNIIHDEEIKENNINPSNILNRKQKLKKILDDTDKEKFDELVKYEEANYKIKTKISIKNVMELKDYYIHQQDTQIIFVAEINDLEQEMDQKKQRLAELK